VFTFGYGGDGQLGLGDLSASPTPRLVNVSYSHSPRQCELVTTQDHDMII